MWEAPRLPDPRLQGKYPLAYPWSPAARARVEGTDWRRPPGGWRLVIEHLRPRTLLVMRALASAESLTSESLVDMLHHEISSAIVTKEEDERLTRARLGSTMPLGDDGSNPWARYIAAGLDVSDFDPITRRSDQEGSPVSA